MSKSETRYAKPYVLVIYGTKSGRIERRFAGTEGAERAIGQWLGHVGATSAVLFYEPNRTDGGTLLGTAEPAGLGWRYTDGPQSRRASFAAVALLSAPAMVAEAKS